MLRTRKLMAQEWYNGVLSSLKARQLKRRRANPLQIEGYGIFENKCTWKNVPRAYLDPVDGEVLLALLVWRHIAVVGIQTPLPMTYCSLAIIG